MKYFYVVDHFAPFPRSEYGGLWNVIAKDNRECFDLIVDYDEKENDRYYTELMANVERSFRFILREDEQSRVIESFTT